MQTIEEWGHAQSIVGRGTKRARAATDDDDEDVVVTMDARSKEGNLNGEREERREEGGALWEGRETF